MRIELLKFTMKELALIKEATGRSVMAEMMKRGSECLDEEIMPALVWIERRRTEPDLTYDDVTSTLEWEAITKGGSIVVDLGGDPPSSAAGSMTRKRSRPSAGSTPPGHLAP